ncbi:MAG: DMT family transporter [Neomegalonema sp.]|nr:DMT family transporter [Neomegalonema sp.]
MLARLGGPLFVLLWSTGFIGAKFGLPYAEPLTFLTIRFCLVALALGAFAVAMGHPWPKREHWPALFVVGVLIHAAYLSGTFVAISRGLEAGSAALIAGLQPVVTALLARRYLGERLNALQWFGMLLGVIGVVLVIWRKLGDGLGEPIGLGVMIGGTIAIAVAQVIQKRRLGGMPMVTGNCLQIIAAGIVTAPLALLIETNEVSWTPDFIFAMSWLVLVLSIGAITVLYFLLRAGEAARVASLFFLVPASTATIAYLMFDEVLGPIEVVGIVCATIGVGLVTLTGRKARA